MSGVRPSREISRGSFYLSLEQISLAVFGVVYVMLLLRLLGPDQYGVFVVGLAVAGMAGIGSGNFEAFLERYTAEYKTREEWSSLKSALATVTVIKVVLATALWALVALAASRVAGFYGMGRLAAVLPFMGALILTEATIVSTRAFLFGMKKYGTIAALSTGTSLAKISIVLHLMVAGTSLRQFVEALVILLSLSASIYAAVAFGLASRFSGRTRLFDGAVLHKMLRYCIPLLGARAAFLSGQHLNKLILGTFLPAAAVGYFAFAFTLVEKFVAIVFAIPASLLPTLTSLRAAGNFRKLGEVFWQGVRLVEVAAVLLASFVFFFAGELVLVLGGREFVPAVVLVRVLALTPIFRTSQQPFTSLFYAYERTRTVLVLALIKLGAEVLFYVLLLPSMGVTGAALGTLLAFAACFTPAYAIGSKMVGEKRFGAEATLLKGVLLVVIIVAISTIIEMKAPASLSIGLVKALAFPPLVLAVLFATGAVNREDLERVGEMELGSPLIARIRSGVLPILLAFQRRLQSSG